MEYKLLQRNYLYGIFLTLAFLCCSNLSLSQCNQDVTICEPGVAGPFDFIPADSNVSSCLAFINGQTAPNYGYITLYITSPGDLNLLISSDLDTGYLDVAIFNVTGLPDPCNSMTVANEISCNYAALSSGCNEFGSTFPCASEVPAPVVAAGDVLMILVEDYSDTATNFTLELSNAPGSAQTGPAPAGIYSVAPLCESVAPFQLTAQTVGGIWSGTGVTPDGIFDPSVGPGTYTIEYHLGTAPCESMGQTEITVLADPIVNAGNDIEVCEGESVTLSGAGADMYYWSDALVDGGSFVPAVGTSTYTLLGAYANGCSALDDVTVVVNALPTVTADNDLELCEGETATLTANGADTYVWNNGVVNGNAFTPNVGVETYTVTGTDLNGCTDTEDVVITVNALPVVDAGTDVDLCYGETTTLSGSGADSYVWDNSVTDNTAFMPSVGSINYTVTGTDNNGCVDTDMVTVNVASIPDVNAGPDENLCEGESLTLTATADMSLTLNWNNGITDGVSFVPNAGTVDYIVEATNASGCVNSDTLIVTVTSPSSVSAGNDVHVCDGESVTLTGSGASDYDWNNPAVTNGQSFVPPVGVNEYVVTGSVGGNCAVNDTVIVTVNQLPVISAGNDEDLCEGETYTLNGIGGDTYVWDNSVQNGVGFNPPVGSVTYTVIGTDVNGCEGTDDVTIVVNALPTVTADNDLELCEGETATLTANGADTYVWNNGVVNGNAFTPNVGVETYTVTGTDLNGCTDTEDVVITVNALPVVDAGTDVDLCYGETTTLSGSGADSYVWDNSVTDNTAFMPSVGSINYTVTGTDNNGCVDTDMVTVNVASIPDVNAGPDENLCEGESLTLTATADMSLTLDWNNGITDGVSFVPNAGTVDYIVEATNASGCVNSDTLIVTVTSPSSVSAGNDVHVCDGESVTLTGSGASDYDWNNPAVTNGQSFVPPVGVNEYVVTGSVGGNCAVNDTVIVTVNQLPVISAGNDEFICEGETYTLNGIGGDTYVWDNSVQNGVGFNPSVGSVTYTVIGTDVNGCEGSDDVDITVVAQTQVNAGDDVTVCEGDQVMLTATGADNYVWDNPMVTNGQEFTPGLGVHVCSVLGSNVNNCESTDTVVITVNALPVVGAGQDQSLCEGEEIAVQGSGAHDYVWDNGVVNAENFPVVIGTTTYTVTGTDVNGCVGTDQMTIDVMPNTQVNAGADITVCEGEDVILTASGADIINWQTPGVSNGIAFTPVVGTTVFEVEGSNANNCLSTDEVVVEVTALPNVNAGPDQNICVGTEVSVNATGADSYAWNNGLSNNVLFTPTVGVNTYTVTGVVNGCESTDDVVVTASEPIEVTFVASVIEGCPPMEVEFTNTSLGAITNSEWVFGDGQFSSENLNASNTYQNSGVYDVTFSGTDQSGCEVTGTVNQYIVVDTIPEIAFTADQLTFSTDNTEVNFINQSTGAVEYEWIFGNGYDSGETNPSTEYMSDFAAEYYVTLTGYSENGCENNSSLILKAIEELVYYIPNSFTPDNDNYNPTFLPIMTSGIDRYDYNLKIFNRWGQIIFESKDIDTGWDGTYNGEVMSDGVYNWSIEVKSSSTDERIHLNGLVNLLK